MAKFSTVVAATAGGMVAGLIFQETVRRSVRAVAKSVVHGFSDAYQSLREDLDDLRAEIAAERDQRQTTAAPR